MSYDRIERQGVELSLEFIVTETGPRARMEFWGYDQALPLQMTVEEAIEFGELIVKRALQALDEEDYRAPISVGQLGLCGGDDE